MDWLIWVAGGAGVVAAGCAFAFWRYLSGLSKEATQAEVLRHEIKQKDDALKSVAEAAKIRNRLTSDPDYARRVRKEFTRD